MKIPVIVLSIIFICQWAYSQTLDLQLKKVPTGIKCPFKSISLSRQLPSKKAFFLGADLLLRKNSESQGMSMQYLVKTYCATTPLYAGFQISEDYFVQAGPYLSILANRLVDNPIEYTGDRPEATELGFDGGFSAALGCNISEHGSLKLRYNLGLTRFHSDFKYVEHPNTRRIEVGLNLKL